MSRSTFGGYGGDQVAQDPTGNSGFYKSAANLPATGTFWSTQTGGTQYTDLIDPVSSVALTGISTDSRGHIALFKGPDGVVEGWVDFGAGRFKISAVDANVNDARYPLKGATSVLVRDSGAKGDNSTDDTAAINTCITNNPGREIRFTNNAAGNAVYMVNATANTGVSGNPVGIKLNQPGTHLVLEPGVTLKVIPNSSQLYACIQVTAADCAVTGGTIIGDVGTHTGSGGEWGHGIDINAGADRFRCTGTKVTLCWGDGFEIGGATGPVDVRLIDVVADSNRRQGLSITNAVRPTVLGGRFMNTGSVAFTSPGAGIDVEPNTGVGGVSDLLISGAQFIGNAGPGFLSYGNSQPVNGLVVGCLSDGSGIGTVKGAGFTVVHATNQIELKSCTSRNNGTDGFVFDPTTDGNTATGCRATGNARWGFGVYGDRIDLTSCSASGNMFNGYFVDPGSDGSFLSSCSARGNSQTGPGSYINFDIQGTNTTLTGCSSHAGTATNKPAYGFTNRTGASGNQFFGCSTYGAFTSAPWLDQAGNAFCAPVPGSTLAASYWNTHFRPETDGAFDVGSAANRWRHTYLDGVVVQTPTAQTLAANGAVTIAAATGDVAITLQANATSSTITGAISGAKLTVTWIQDATGGRTYAWPTNCKFAGGSAPADTTASKQSTVTFRYDGTNWQELSRAVAVG